MAPVNDPEVVGYLLFVAGVFFYLLPAILAHRRRHKSRVAITLVCILAGWTGAGWFIALVWAGTGNVEGRPPTHEEVIESELCGMPWLDAHFSVAKEMGVPVERGLLMFSCKAQYREFDRRVAARLQQPRGK